MKQLKFFLFLILSISQLSCGKENDDTITEQQIFATILPEMGTAVYKDPRIYLNFQKAAKSGNINLEQTDTLTSRQDNDKKMIIAISDVLNPPDASDAKSMLQIIKSNNLNIQISTDKLSHKLVHQTYNNKHYSFKYFSKPGDEESTIYTDGINIFNISISFSRIQFDKKKEYGILSGMYDCLPNCGVGYIIVVKKTPGGWKIYKVFDTWVS